jgi:hypothetical protein
MILSQRIELMNRLGDYLQSNEIAWQEAKQKASYENGWFIPEFVELAVNNIRQYFLKKDILEKWTDHYKLPTITPVPKTIGIVMAGNIPLVGFHDLLCVFMSGNKALIKPSSKDEVLIKHLSAVLQNWEPGVNELIQFSVMLKNCDAYIATGSYNTSRYFEYYFGKYPHIIRLNKTSVAILTGYETNDELENLADDVYRFFGLGCRNVTKIYVPAGYDFVPLLAAFKKYKALADHHKYKNNYDYNLAIHILNNKFYMTNGSILLIEEPSLFSPISQLNYEYYSDKNSLLSSLHDNKDLQCIAGQADVPFGKTQEPGIFDYADRVDTMAFLNSTRS